MLDRSLIAFEASNGFSSRAGHPITHVVIHVTEGSWPGCKEWLKYKTELQTQRSAHYCVSRGGKIVQLVHEYDKAWHACNANPFSIGVEHEGFSDQHKPTWKGTMPDSQWRASLSLVASICDSYLIPYFHVLGHDDPWLKQYGNDHTDPGQYIDMVQYRTELSQLLHPGGTQK